MFDEIPQSQSSSRDLGWSPAGGKLSRPVIVAIVLALFGLALTITLPSDPSEGFHIEFIGP